jgi:DNA-binding NtrC family response regulator
VSTQPTPHLDLADRFGDRPFEVLATDLKMQKPDGLEVMDFVKENSPATMVIIITGNATVETARDAMKGGAVDFIAKPCKISQLRDLIVAVTDSDEMTRRNGRPRFAVRGRHPVREMG